MWADSCHQCSPRRMFRWFSWPCRLAVKRPERFPSGFRRALNFHVMLFMHSLRFWMDKEEKTAENRRNRRTQTHLSQPLTAPAWPVFHLFCEPQSSIRSYYQIHNFNNFIMWRLHAVQHNSIRMHRTRKCKYQPFNLIIYSVYDVNDTWIKIKLCFVYY